MFSLLEGDGVIENIYHLLWAKDSIFGKESYVIIPDTIIIKFQKPCYWYFTSSQDNKIKKKVTSKLTKELIKEKFLSNVSKSGIVAYFLHRKLDLNNNINSFYETEHSKEKDNMGYLIEYFDTKNFEEVLDNLNLYSDGILQKFIDPKGDHNFTLRLIWSPKICVFEKRTNIKNLFHNKFSIYERVVTYDGEEYQSKNESIYGNSLPDRLEKIGNSISSHISNVTLERIKIVRMVLNFKITNNDTIILLWCSSLRLENLQDKKSNNKSNSNNISKFKECEVNKIKINLSSKVEMFKFSNYGKPIKPLKDFKCSNCLKKTESYKLSNITFKYIIESYDNKKRVKSGFDKDDNVLVTFSGIDVIPYNENKPLNQITNISHKIESTRQQLKNQLIPPIISNIYTKMTTDEYQILKNEYVFTHKTALVCEICYLELTKYCRIVGTNNLNLIKEIKPFIPSKNKVTKSNEVLLFLNKLEGMKNNIKETSKLIETVIKGKKTPVQLNRNITNQMFFTETRNILPQIKTKDNKMSTIDNSINHLTTTNLETNESEKNII